MKFLLFVGILIACFSVKAQNIFWSFNDKQQPMTIAPECDARFEEIRGGVFMPSVEEVYQHGVEFLASSSDEIRRQAPYCFLSAAIQGNADAQFQLAKMYNKGDILPQDDLSAYKWAFIAALNGNKDAELFTLNLEQVLTTDDLEATGAAIYDARTEIQENMQRQLEDLKERNNVLNVEKEQKGGKPRAPMPTKLTDIFNEKDHY